MATTGKRLTAAAVAARGTRGRDGRRSVTRRPAAKQPAQAQQERTRRAGTRRVTQLAVSAVILAAVVAVKFTMPDVMADYGDKARALMNNDTDFVAAFSAVGRAVGGEELASTVENVCISVFGSQNMGESDPTVDRNAVIYSAAATPADADMLQRVLGFTYQTPLHGTLSSSFGYRNHPANGDEKFHYGVDLAAEEGAIICAFADGKVSVVAESAELGHYIEISHDNGCSTLYAHCRKVTASAGQYVKMGDPVAEVGATGDATGNHLHFEVMQGSMYLNPIYYVT